MNFCLLIILMASLALLVGLIPFVVDRWLKSLHEFFTKLCDRICRLWIYLAFSLGAAVGGFALCCWQEFQTSFNDSDCRFTMFWGLVLLLILLFRYLTYAAHCSLDNKGTITRGIWSRVSPPYIVPFLLLALLASILWCCWPSIAAGTPGWDVCDILFVLLLLLFLITAILCYISAKFCKKNNDDSCSRKLRLTWLLLVLLIIFLITTVFRCCDEFHDEYELAMVGIWWEGKHEGEEGVHLRWSFKTQTETEAGLSFPEDGFDIQRREVGSNNWITLNSERIRPITEWGDESTPVAGDMSQPVAIERLHADDWDNFRGESTDDLIDMLGRNPYDKLYYVETPEPSIFTAPANPYQDESSRQAYIDSYNLSAASDKPLLALWEIEPMSTMMTTAMHNEIARLVGLAYVDKEADAVQAYDYRVIGYWLDKQRQYTIFNVSQATTSALQKPSLLKVESKVVLGEVELDNNEVKDIIDDRTVGLTWDPPGNQDPSIISGLLDKISSVLFNVDHAPVYIIGDEELDDISGLGSCVSPTDTSLFTPAKRNTVLSLLSDSEELLEGTGENVPDILPPALVSPLEDDVTGQLSWAQYFFYHRNLDYGCHAYRVTGMDVFGRLSSPSDGKAIKVDDVTAPPEPALVRVNILQRQDKALTQEQKTLFPDDTNHNYVFTISWVWPGQLAARAPDLKYFKIYANLNNFNPFPGETPSIDPPAWKDAVSWNAHDLAGSIDKSTGQALPASYSALGFLPADSLYFKVSFTEQDLAARGISLADMSLNPGDTVPVDYTSFGVASVDRAPYSNTGDVSAPVIAVARDLIPPDAPNPGPNLSAGPYEADAKGNSGLRVGFPGASLYTYNIYRANIANITIDENIPDSELPTCWNTPEPIRTEDLSDDNWTMIQRHYHAQRTVARDLAVLQSAGTIERISPIQLSPASDGGDITFDDNINATESSEHIYIATALDAAGNESVLSCPGKVVLVEDGVAPRTPVVRAIDSGDNRIVIRWNINQENDLSRYNIYRTESPEKLSSRRKMHHIASMDKDGVDIPASGPSTSNALKQEAGAYSSFSFSDDSVEALKTYYYRLEAVDLSGNRSPLSNAGRNAAFDKTAPVAPVWLSPDIVITPSTATGQFDITLKWSFQSDDNQLRNQIQMQESNSTFWRPQGGWTETAMTEHVLVVGAEAGSTLKFRMRAMDPSGNRSDWSSVLDVVIPN